MSGNTRFWSQTESIKLIRLFLEAFYNEIWIKHQNWNFRGYTSKQTPEAWIFFFVWNQRHKILIKIMSFVLKCYFFYCRNSNFICFVHKLQYIANARPETESNLTISAKWNHSFAFIQFYTISCPILESTCLQDPQQEVGDQTSSF